MSRQHGNALLQCDRGQEEPEKDCFGLFWNILEYLLALGCSRNRVGDVWVWRGDFCTHQGTASSQKRR